MKNFMIRPYNSSDKESLLKIFKRNVPKFFDKSEIKDFEAYLEQRAATYLTIELANTIVGGIGYYANEPDKSGRITWIFFDPSCTGQGLGKQSVAYCLNVLSKDDRVEKFIVTTSQLAYKFFEKFGYRIDEIKENYWGKDLDLYKMTKPNKKNLNR